MRVSHLAVGVVVLSLLAVAVAAGPAAAAEIEGTDENEEAICGDASSGNSLVIVLPDETYVHSNDEATLLPGTTGDLVLCSDGDLQPIPSAWELDEGAAAGLNVTGTYEFNYDITVENVETSTDVEFALTTSPGSPGSVGSPAVTATPGQVTTARLGGETYSIALNEDQASTFTEANESYVETLGEIHSSAETLNRSTERNRIIATSNTTQEWVSDINQTRTVRTNYVELQRELFSSARSGNANAAEALNGYEAYHDRTLARTSDELESAKQNIDQQASATALGVLANFVGVLLVGAVVGGIGGRVATNRVLAKVEDKRRRSSAVDFHPKHLAGQLLLALVLLGAAVTVVVTQGLLDPLLAVFSAVIGP